MNTTTNQTGNEVKLTITAEEADLAPTVKSVYNNLRKDVDAKGFRPGKAPNEVVERELGSDKVQLEVVNAAAEKLYRQAIQEHQINPISNPHVEVKKVVPYTELEIEVTVEVMPEVTLPDYKNTLSVEPKDNEVSDEEVEGVLNSLQERLADRDQVERAAKSGDEVALDFHGTKDGEDIPGAQETNYSLVLGSGNFIPGFEDEIIGLKAGDEKTFEIKFPDDYPEKSLAGQTVEFKVKIHSVSSVTKPELNDEFAKSAGPFESLSGLKTDVRSHLQSEKEQAASRRDENEVLRQLVDQAEVDVPESMLEREYDRVTQDVDKRLAEQGVERKDYLEQTKKSEEEFEKELKEQAVERAKTALVLTKVADTEELEVTPEEVEVQIQMLAGQYQDDKVQEELKKPEVRREISNQMLADKTVKKLIEYATSQTESNKKDGAAALDEDGKSNSEKTQKDSNS